MIQSCKTNVKARNTMTYESGDFLRAAMACICGRCEVATSQSRGVIAHNSHVTNNDVVVLCSKTITKTIFVSRILRTICSIHVCVPSSCREYVDKCTLSLPSDKHDFDPNFKQTLLTIDCVLIGLTYQILRLIQAAWSSLDFQKTNFSQKMKKNTLPCCNIMAKQARKILNYFCRHH